MLLAQILSYSAGPPSLEGLKAHWAAGHRPRIILVGHSTGAVYICHFLKEAAARLPAEIQFEVVFLAAACTFDLLADTLSEHGDRIRAFRAFGMKDALEAVDQLVPVVPIYPRSLLYFVSGVVEDEPDKPLVGMERFFSGQPPYDDAANPPIKTVRGFAQAGPNRTIWSIAEGEAGLISAAQSHGQFSSADVGTLESVSHIIKEGL
jgi:hypothetical protein